MTTAKEGMRHFRLTVVLLFVSTLLLNFTARETFSFEIPRKEELE